MQKQIYNSSTAKEVRVTLIAKELRRAACPVHLSPATQEHTAASQRGPQYNPTAAPGAPSAPKSRGRSAVASACASRELPPRRPRQSPGAVGPRPRVRPLPVPAELRVPRGSALDPGQLPGVPAAAHLGRFGPQGHLSNHRSSSCTQSPPQEEPAPRSP